MITKILMGVGIIIALLLIVAAIAKKQYVVERAVTIKKSKSDVFDYIKYLKNQDQYSKWATIDPGMKKEYRGTDGTAGFIYAWDSENRDAGKGEQEIRSITEGERIDYNLHFIKPFDGRANASLITESVSPNETKVTWHFDGKMPYPMNLMLLFMNMDKAIGKDLETGLANLKTRLETENFSTSKNQ